MSWISLALAALASQPPLPIVRPLMSPPPVGQIGGVHRTDGTAATVPITDGFALADIDVTAWNAGTVFSISAPGVPTDSLARARASRAGAWVARLPVTGQGPLMEPELRAELAAAAGDDAAAARFFEAAVASATPSQRSHILSRAIVTFTDHDRDDSTLARRIVIAEPFLASLMMLRRGGYPFWWDSIALLQRTYESAQALLSVSVQIGDTTRVRMHTRHLLASLARFGGFGRAGSVSERYFPYDELVATLLGEVHGRTRVDWLIAQLQRVAALTGAEVAALPPNERASANARVSQVIIDRTVTAKLLGQRAPAIVAHAWLNTSDSMYAAAPRAHPLDDGAVRLLVFAASWMHNGRHALFPALDRLQRRVAPWGQIVLVTQTEGAIGSELAEPADEVAWIRGLLHEQLPSTMVVALWAGAKSATPDGDSLPMSPPLEAAYQRVVNAHDNAAIIVDGRGVVRGIAVLESRRDEETLWRALEYLHGEGTGDATARARPVPLIPRTVDE